MTITKMPNGALLIYQLLGSQLLSQVYYFYTRKEAKERFLAYYKEQSGNLSKP